MSTVWSMELEDGCQAFGMAARALGAIDAEAWPQLAEYLMYVDDGHECFFRRETEPHFIETHGWRDESFNLALSVIVQMRGNLGDNYRYVWEKKGLSAAAETACAPAEFAARMLSMRDRMVASAAGSFAELLARRNKEDVATYGWQTYDDLFEQIQSRLTRWEERLFEELARQSK